MTEYHCLTGYGLCKTSEHYPCRWWHGSSCPALLSCRQAFQRSLLSTEAQGKLYQVQGLGHKQNQRWTWQQCMSSDPVYPCHPGCDSTSILKWLGKFTTLKMISKNTKFHEIAHIIFCNDTNTPQEDTVKVGEEALLCVYNGSAKNDPDSLRYERYSEKVKEFSNAVEAYKLPPTSAPTRYHNLRVYSQVNEENGKKRIWRNRMGMEIIWVQTGTEDYWVAASAA